MQHYINSLHDTGLIAKVLFITSSYFISIGFVFVFHQTFPCVKGTFKLAFGILLNPQSTHFYNTMVCVHMPVSWPADL